MEEQKFIIDEATKRKSTCRQARGRTNTKLLTQCRKCRRLRGLYSPTTYLQWKEQNTPVNVEEMYIYCDEWEEFYNETVVKVAQAILEAEQIKEA